MDPREIQALIQNALPGATAVVEDTVGDGDHLQAVVISEAFEGKTLLQQHQLVYGALKDSLKERLHALGLKTYTPEQWKNNR